MSSSDQDTETESSEVSEEEHNELALQLPAAGSPPRALASAAAPASNSTSYPLRGVVRQQQDATKTCRLLALEVGSLKAELTREHKKRAQAVHRASTADSAQHHAEQRLQELQYSNTKLQQGAEAARQLAESSSRRVQSLRQSLADAEAEAQQRSALGQQQVWCGAGS